MQNSAESTPSYLRIQNYVFSKIEDGEYPIGSRIPPETELAKLFSVSRVTANKAIKEMSVMGVLERIRGKGTYVCSDRTSAMSHGIGLSSINLSALGDRSHQLVQFRVIKACEPLTEKAHVTENALFYEIIFINKNKGHDESLDFTYIPTELVTDITKLLTCLDSHFVYDYLKTLPNANPKFMEIHLNVPYYDFLHSSSLFLNCSEDMSSWCTDIYDVNMNFLATTFTTYPSSSQDIPLPTFTV